MRQPVPDLIKGIAVLAMIQVHVMEQFARPEILNGPPGKASLFLGGPFAAPVFMTVMGYFLAASTRSPLQKMKRGGALILTGLLLNIGLNFNLLVRILAGTSEADPLQYLFGADILPLAGLSVILIGILEMAPVKKTLPALALALAIPLATPYMTALPQPCPYLQAFIAGPEKWSYFPLFPWLAYPLAGYAWKRMETEMLPVSEWMKKNRLLLLVLAAPVVLALSAWAFRIITDLKAYYHHGFLLFIWMTGFLSLWTALAGLLHKNNPGSPVFVYIRGLGKNVTAVYVVQWLIIGNLAYYFAGSQHLIQLILWFAFLLSLTSAFVYIYRGIRSGFQKHEKNIS